MNQNPTKKIFSIFIFIFFLILFFGGGFFLGYQNKLPIEKITGILNKTDQVLAESKENEEIVDFSPFWKVWKLIDEKHPIVNSLEKKKITAQEKVWGAISGLASSLEDPYTVFFPPEEAKLFEESINGEFGGIGIEIGIKDKILTVIAPLKNTPAEKAGIMAGDKIIKINDLETSEINIDKAVKMIRGEKGTEVKLTIYREIEGKPREISLIRDVINIPTLDTEIKNDVFVIKLYNFSANSDYLFKEAMKKFIASNTAKLVLDLRNNPGGYLESAVEIASLFLPKDKIVVTENFGENNKEKVYYSKGYNIFNNNLKMVTLVNNGSASASEILAGALQKHERSKLVGETTYGKGSVQELIKITPETSLKITIAEWLVPGGLSISKNGLKPDYEIKLTAEDIEKKQDPQMVKALELLK